MVAILDLCKQKYRYIASTLSITIRANEMLCKLMLREPCRNYPSGDYGGGGVLIFYVEHTWICRYAFIIACA